MLTVQTTQTFDDWLSRLRDRRAVAVINARITRMTYGLLGDEKTVGHGVRELRIHVGPGYRLYYVMRKQQVVILLCGGDKSTQQADIRLAIQIAHGEFDDGGKTDDL